MKSWAENKIFYTNQTLNIQGRVLDLKTPQVMGILNVTPDSFYDGGQYDSESAILSHVETMLSDGATFIDVGGYSSRPGAADVPVEEETRRVTKALQLIAKNFPKAICSIDTFRSVVAKAAIEAGAVMVNDISGGEQDDRMIELVASRGIPYVLMHMRGNPKSMSGLTQYDNVLKEVVDHLANKISILYEKGITDVIIDPGFGFSKTIEQNFLLLNHLEYFQILHKPILVGLSRKSMIWKTLKTTPDNALNGTACLNTIALLKGANILRVHDVKEATELCKLISATAAVQLTSI